MFTALAKLPVWLLLLLSAAGVIAGDYFSKSWSVNQRVSLAALAIAGYACSAIFYMPTLLREGLIVTSVVWSVLSIIGFLVIGLFVFNETLTPLQWLGVGFGVVSLITLSFAH